MIHEKLSFVSELLAQLRQHVRPEGEAAFSAVSVAMEQAHAESGEPVAPLEPLQSQLQAIAADVAAIRVAVGV